MAPDSRNIIKKLYRRLYLDSRIKSKLIMSFSLSVIMPVMLLGTITYTFTRNYLVGAERNSITNSMKQLNNSIDYFYGIYMNKSLMLYSNPDIQKIATNHVHDIEEKTQLQLKIYEIIGQITSDTQVAYLKDSYYFGGTLKVEIYLKNDTIYANNDDIFYFEDAVNQEWYKSLKNSGDYYGWQSNVVDKDGNEYICLNQRLVDFKDSSDIGVLRIMLPIERVREILVRNVYSEATNFTYTDEKYGKIVTYGKLLNDDTYFNKLKALNLEKGVNVVTLDGKKYLVGLIHSKITGWNLIYLVPMSVITDKTRNISVITVLTAFFSILICFIIASFVAERITRRIDVLVEKTNRIKKGDFTIREHIEGKDEIGQLDENFNSMVERVSNLIENDYKSKILINKTRFELLQEQINPHLLYNTLTTVSLSAKSAGQPGIMSVTNNLISFYKSILNRGSIICSIQSEVEMVKRYIEIMKYVYQLDIETTLDIEEQIPDYFSIKLILQPVVENAIVHGLRPKNGGSLYISGYQKEGAVIFDVSDDGIGMDGKTIEGIKAGIFQSRQEGGYGLGNVIRRINLFFGDSFGVDISSTPGAGTSVSIRVPALTEKEMEDLLEGFWKHSKG